MGVMKNILDRQAAKPVKKAKTGTAKAIITEKVDTKADAKKAMERVKAEKARVKALKEAAKLAKIEAKQTKAAERAAAKQAKLDAKQAKADAKEAARALKERAKQEKLAAKEAKANGLNAVQNKYHKLYAAFRKKAIELRNSPKLTEDGLAKFDEFLAEQFGVVSVITLVEAMETAEVD